MGPVFSSKPIAEDIFRGTSLNRKLWPVVYGKEVASNGGFWWDDALTQVRGGTLRLAMRRDAGGSWTAGGASMIPKSWEPGLAIRYGKVDIIARVTNPIIGAGPCFLMWPADGSWSHEIDILETPQGRGMFTVHHKDPAGGDVGESRLFDIDLKNFHTYTLEWTPRSAALRIDGEIVTAITEHIPDVPMSVGLQGHIGAPHEGWYGRPAPGPDLHSEIIVASVRVFSYLRGS